MQANTPYYIWKLAKTVYLLKVPVVPFLLQQVMRIVLNCYIPYKADIGKNVHFGHLGLGIVIHPGSKIGDNVKINHNVTIGGRSDTGLPTIGNNVRIGAGAQILGGIKIGDYAQIGANAVVIKDIPAHATAVGIPAKIIAKDNK